LLYNQIMINTLDDDIYDDTLSYQIQKVYFSTFEYYLSVTHAGLTFITDPG